MNSITVILVSGSAAGLVMAYSWYVLLVKRRNRVLEALSGVDVQLRQRHDLVPNILRIAQSFMSHEKDLLSAVTEARSRAVRPYSVRDPSAVQAHLKASDEVASGLGRLFAVSESYPDVESRELMLKAQETCEEIEGHIAAARRAYNAVVTDLNNAVQIFPGSLIAIAARIGSMPFYEIETAAKDPVDASKFLMT